MQIVSEIAEIVASAIDCVLVLWFLTSHFGKKKTIEWWKSVSYTHLTGNIFFYIIMIMLYYSLGTALERTWGTFRFNVYILSLIHI